MRRIKNSDSKTNKKNIIHEERCPISFKNTSELGPDGVVFRRRIYSYEALFKWYLERLKDGETELKDIVTAEVLPPITINNKTSLCDNILNYVPKLTEIEHRILLYSCLLLHFLGHLIDPKKQSNHFVSESSLVNFRFAITALIIIAGVPLYAHYRQRYREHNRRNQAQPNEVLEEWLEKQISPYSPEDYSHKSNTP